MVAVDTNVLVYAHRAESSWHSRADQVIAALAEGKSLWAIPWPCLYEFYAVVTHQRIYRPPTPYWDALRQIQGWLQSPTVILLSEDQGFTDILAMILEKSAVTGGAVHDARVAALCIRHGVEKLLTADRDFSRFPQLSTENPLLP